MIRPARLPELRIVGEALADEARLVRPDHGPRDVVDLQANQLGHEDDVLVERREAGLGLRRVRARKYAARDSSALPS